MDKRRCRVDTTRGQYMWGRMPMWCRAAEVFMSQEEKNREEIADEDTVAYLGGVERE